MNSRGLIVIVALILAATVATPGAAEEALVLSGGGSRGLAHAGVVLGLERRGHDPGIVVGTSMGSIVGALYAAGYNARAVDSLLEVEDWRVLFTPFPFEVGPDRALRYPVIRLDTTGGSPIGSRAYIPDWRINRRLTQLLFDPSARARGDFDRLPRRFRSMTADAENGALISLGSGDLARAVRASMAAAGFFAPVRWRDPIHGSPLLTDGGIADYLPVAEARRLGGAPIIASDVLLPPARLPTTDALAVARRSTELLSIHARREPVAPDLLILPAVDPGLAPFDYPIEPAPVIDAGLRSTLAALPDSGTSTAPESRRPLPPPDSLSGLAIEDGGIPETADTRLHGFLWRAFQGEAPAPYRADRILATLDRLYATGLFDGIWPSVEPRDAPVVGGSALGADSTAAPILRVRAESRGLASVAGALGYDNDRGGRIWASLRRLDAVGSYPLEIALEGTANGIEQSGSVSARLTSLLLGASAWTAGARFGESEARFLEAEGVGGGIETSRAGGWVGFETRRLAPAFHAAAMVRAEQIQSDFGPEGGSYGPCVRIEGVPRLLRVVGATPSVEAEARFGEVSYRRARARASLDHEIGPVLGAIVGDAAAVSRGAPIDAAPGMGGDGLIPGLREGERLGRARAVLGADLAISAVFNTTLRLRARGGVVADETRTPQGILYSREHLWLGGVRLSGLWWTPFGPIEIGGEGSTLGDRRVVVTIGAEF